MKRMIAFLNVMMLAICMVGCEDRNSEQETVLNETYSNIEETSETSNIQPENLTESAYVSIWDLDSMVRSYNSAKNENTIDYSSVEKSVDIDKVIKERYKEFGSEVVLFLLGTLYLNENNYTRYSRWGYPNYFVNISGTFEVNKGNGELKSKPDYFTIKDRENMDKCYKFSMDEEVVNENIPQNILDAYYHFYSWVEEMEKVENFTGIIATNCIMDAVPLIPICYTYDEKNEIWRKDTYRSSEQKLILKGDFLVAEQRGYTMTDVDNGDIAFEMRYDNSDIVKDIVKGQETGGTGKFYIVTEQETEGTIKFYKDNTWEADINDWNIKEGTWKIYHDNLLCLSLKEYDENETLTQEERRIKYSYPYVMFYIDLETKEIYAPAMIRLDTMLKYCHDTKETYIDAGSDLMNSDPASGTETIESLLPSETEQETSPETTTEILSEISRDSILKILNASGSASDIGELTLYYPDSGLVVTENMDGGYTTIYGIIKDGVYTKLARTYFYRYSEDYSYFGDLSDLEYTDEEGEELRSNFGEYSEMGYMISKGEFEALIGKYKNEDNKIDFSENN